MKDEDATPSERREAEALARALEGGETTGAPAELLETAALLGHRELDPDRAAAVRARVLANPARRPSLWWWLAPLGAIATAAALAVMVISRAGPPATPLPPPTPALLAAQARAMGEHAAASLDGEMRGYRHEVLSALARRYGRAP